MDNIVIKYDEPEWVKEMIEMSKNLSDDAPILVIDGLLGVDIKPYKDVK